MRVISAVFFALVASVSAKCSGNYDVNSLAAVSTKKLKSVNVKKGSVKIKKNKDYSFSLTGSACGAVNTKVSFQYSVRKAASCAFIAAGVATTVAFPATPKKVQSSADVTFPDGFTSLSVECDKTLKLFNAVVSDPSITEPCSLTQDLSSSSTLKDAGDAVNMAFPACGQSGTYEVNFGIKVKKAGSFALSDGATRASQILTFAKKQASVTAEIELPSGAATTATLTLVEGKVDITRVSTGTAISVTTTMPTAMPTAMPTTTATAQPTIVTGQPTIVTGQPTATGVTGQPTATGVTGQPTATVTVQPTSQPSGSSNLCKDIPTCVPQATLSPESVCCGQGAPQLLACCTGLGFTLNPTMFITKSPTQSTLSPSSSPTINKNKFCYKNTHCLTDVLLVGQACFDNPTNLTTFPACTQASSMNTKCCPDTAGVYKTCCSTSAPSSFTNGPTTSNPTTISPTSQPSITTLTPTTSPPTATLLPEMCGAITACNALVPLQVGVRQTCCPLLGANRLSNLEANIAASHACCPCKSASGNIYSQKC